MALFLAAELKTLGACKRKAFDHMPGTTQVLLCEAQIDRKPPNSP